MSEDAPRAASSEILFAEQREAITSRSSHLVHSDLAQGLSCFLPHIVGFGIHPRLMEICWWINRDCQLQWHL